MNLLPPLSSMPPADATEVAAERLRRTLAAARLDVLHEQANQLARHAEHLVEHNRAVLADVRELLAILAPGSAVLACASDESARRVESIRQRRWRHLAASRD